MRKAKKVCKELMIGLIVWIVPVTIVLMIVATHKLAMLAGLTVGTLTAVGLIWHMYRHLDIALDLDVNGAQRHTQISAVKRTFFMAIVLAVSMIYPYYIHPVGVVFGIFGMKISVFMYPKLHKYLQKNKRVKNENQ